MACSGLAAVVLLQMGLMKLPIAPACYVHVASGFSSNTGM
jgi:hypothetical protein